MAAIALVAQKGGVGKSAIARTLAVAAAKAEPPLRVAIADLNWRQQTCYEWAGRRRSLGHTPDIAVEVYQTVIDAAQHPHGNDIIVFQPERAEPATVAAARHAASITVVSRADALLGVLELFTALIKAGIRKDRLKLILFPDADGAIDAAAAATAAGFPPLALDLLVIDVPGEAAPDFLDIARFADRVIQPARARLDDINPAIRLFHELTDAGIDKAKLAILLHGLQTEASGRDARAYIEAAGYATVEGSIDIMESYGKALDAGLGLNETPIPHLNGAARRVMQAILADVRRQSAPVPTRRQTQSLAGAGAQ